MKTALNFFGTKLRKGLLSSFHYRVILYHSISQENHSFMFQDKKVHKDQSEK
ncbi:MAG TPA: hypothetical protein PK622_02220 [Saprospiraceae bacterium]|jgi:hypothetical protein|nr:hypothetical protein [Saprospiraceae bacterium]MBK9992791.1 hypothetical protein [Saprospiraceae bacterium]HOJ90463.1 hypothetical protein [Saprospiraceae bacterium]HUN15593.1 hypothetical protein [Saprospiraceae bacterium]